jgi:hypothetical protein
MSAPDAFGAKPLPVLSGPVTAGPYPIQKVSVTGATTITFSAPDGRVIKLVLLKERGFSPYLTRKVVWMPEANTAILGYSLINRECSVSASSSSSPFDSPEDQRLAQTPNRVGFALFGVNQFDSSPPYTATSRVALVFTDASHTLSIKFATETISGTLPGTSAANVADNDPCLVKREHMSNRFVFKDGRREYRRTDTVVACAIGVRSATGTTAIVEMRRDLRFIEYADATICATPLGIPINTDYKVYTSDIGGAVGVSAECGAGTRTTIAPSAEIISK